MLGDLILNVIKILLIPFVLEIDSILVASKLLCEELGVVSGLDVSHGCVYLAYFQDTIWVLMVHCPGIKFLQEASPELEPSLQQWYPHRWIPKKHVLAPLHQQQNRCTLHWTIYPGYNRWQLGI